MLTFALKQSEHISFWIAKSCLLYTSGKYESVEELENTVIKAVNGRVVRVKDVATVRDTFKETDASASNHIGKGIAPVSYTHLDVYKRQAKRMAPCPKLRKVSSRYAQQRMPSRLMLYVFAPVSYTHLY